MKILLIKKNTYNLRPGGRGGFEKSQQRKGTMAALEKRKKYPEIEKRIVEQAKIGWKKWWNSLSDIDRQNIFLEKANVLHAAGAFNGKKHTPESKLKMSRSHKGKHTGEKNSQHGTCWIYSLTNKINKKIIKSELNLYLEMGWTKGRKMKF